MREQKNEPGTTVPHMLTIEQLHFLQQTVSDKLFQCRGDYVTKQHWELIKLAMSSDEMNCYGEGERSNFIFLYESLKEFFEKLDTLKDPLREIRRKEALCSL